MAQVVNLKINGLHTNNQYLTEVPEGALLQCINFNHDRDGILEKRRGFKVYGGVMTESAKQLLQYKDTIIRHYDDILEYDNGSGTFTNFGGSYTEPASDQRMKYIEANGNLYITTDSGIKKLSALDSTDFSTQDFIAAGGLKALYITASTLGASGFLNNNEKTAYRVVWGIKDRNENLILGTPSERVVLENTSGGGVNATLNFPIPAGATSDHFYQIYRAANVANTTEPEDELFLVIEDFPTSDQLTASSVTVEDLTPESFRESGTLLYTNPISGEGILQANEAPPQAVDLASFRNFTFYANTKTRHKYNFTLLSIDDIYDNVSYLVVSDGTTTRRYKFDTTENLTTHVIKRETSGTTAFNIQETAKSIQRVVSSDSSGIVYGYYLSGPEDLPGQLLFEYRDLSDTPFYIGIESGTISEFNPNLAEGFSGASASVAADSVITMPSSTFNSTADVNIGTDAITITGHKFFEGEEVYTQISSGALPTGLSNGTKYYVFVVDANTIKLCTSESETHKTSPTFVDITATAVGVSILYKTHKLIAGQNFLAYFSTTTPLLDGIKTVKTVTNVFTFTIEDNVSGSGTFNLMALTNKSDNEEKPNRIYYSKFQQPEAVPIVNYFDVGPKNKAIKRIISLRDSLFIFKEDGIYRLTGFDTNNFSVSLFDNSAIIKSPDSAAVLNNLIYLLTSQGVVTCSDTGVQIISKPIENITNRLSINPNYKSLSFAFASESDRSYFLWTITTRLDDVATQCLRYNSDTNSWTIWDKSNTCGLVNNFDDKIYLGADSLYLEIERKTQDRTDYADYEYSITLNNNGLNGKLITSVSDFTNVDKGDVLLQEQYVTIPQFNFLLRKLNLDPTIGRAIESIAVGSVTTFTLTGHLFNSGDIVQIVGVTGTAATFLNTTHEITVLDADTFTVDVNTTIYTASNGYVNYSFEDNILASPGDNIIVDIESLASILQTYFSDNFSDSNTKDSFYGGTSSSCFDTSSPPALWSEAQIVYNLIIDRLNEHPDLTSSNYPLSEDTVIYEEVILENNKRENELTLYTEPLFLEGPITVYKGYTALVEWVPNHAGDPSTQKRIIDATVIMDDQEFSTIQVRYSTDLSKGHEGIEINGEGTGIFGQTAFGEEGFGGVLSNEPIRTLVPREKARCRYISPEVIHINARENPRIFGFSFTLEAITQRAYRGQSKA